MSAEGHCIILAGTVLCGVDADGRMRLAQDAGIIVHEGTIAEIGAANAVVAANPHLPRFGSRRTIAMPGLVNSHHHFGLTPLMLGVPFAPLELWLPRFRAMRQIGARLDTLHSAIEMLESGTTTVHHIQSGLVGTPADWEATTTEVLSTYTGIGMRVGYSFMMRDRNVLAYEDDATVLASLPEPLRNWIAPQLAAAATPTRDYMDFFGETQRHWGETHPGNVRLHLAPANLHWCSDESLQLIFETARDHGASVHMHLLETERQAAFAVERYGCSAVEHLAALGCLGPELTIGHGNWMRGKDLDLVADCGCMICHNASSGLRLGSGIAPVNEMRRRGIPVALGIDQSNICDDRDMMIEMKLVWALHRETGLWNDRPNATEILQMATEHGARSAGFGGMVGRIEPGQRADIVLMSDEAVNRPFVSPRTPVSEAVLHRAGKQSVDKVFVDGRLVVDGGRVIAIDRHAAMKEIADRLAAPETPAEAEAWEMVGALVAHLEDFHRRHPLTDGGRSYRYNAMGDG
jgi:cytosine/adenosine deaminase-related metal-dependent hydrolase